MSDVSSVFSGCGEPSVTSLMAGDDVMLELPVYCGGKVEAVRLLSDVSGLSAECSSGVEACRIAASSRPNSSSTVGNRTVTSGVESGPSTGEEIWRLVAGSDVIVWLLPTVVAGVIADKWRRSSRLGLGFTTGGGGRRFAALEVAESCSTCVTSPR